MLQPESDVPKGHKAILSFGELQRLVEWAAKQECLAPGGLVCPACSDAWYTPDNECQRCGAGSLAKVTPVLEWCGRCAPCIARKAMESM